MKIKKVTPILSILINLSMLILLAYGFSSKEFQFNTFEFLIVCSIIVVLFILNPLFELISETKRRKFAIKVLILKIGLSVLLITSVYFIYYLTFDNLSAAYYTMFISATLLILLNEIETIRKFDIKSKLEGTMFDLLLLGQILLMCLPMVFYLYTISTIFYKPTIVDSFAYLQSPARIEIKKEPASIDTILDNNIDQKVASITDSLEIETIMNDIKNTDLKCLSGVKYLDYRRKEATTKPHYQIFFHYLSNDNKPNLIYLELNNHNEAVAYVISYRTLASFNPLSNFIKSRYYPIDLSPASLNILSNYISKNQAYASNGESQ